MRIIKKAMLKKSYGAGMRCDELIAYKTSAYWPVGTIVEVIGRGKGKSSIVLLPTNEYDPSNTRNWKGNIKDLKFIK